MPEPSDTTSRVQSASDEIERPTVWLTLTEASDRFDVGRSTLRRRIDDGLEAARQADDGHGSWLVSLDWLTATYRQRPESLNAPEATRADPDALNALIAERSDSRIREVQHLAEIETIKAAATAELHAVTAERDRLREEVRRARSDAEEAQRRVDRAQEESAEAGRRLDDALSLIDTFRSRSEQLTVESSKNAVLAAERAAQVDSERAQRERAAQELEATMRALTEAQANARWSYRRRLRKLP